MSSPAHSLVAEAKKHLPWLDARAMITDIRNYLTIMGEREVHCIAISAYDEKGLLHGKLSIGCPRHNSGPSSKPNCVVLTIFGLDGPLFSRMYEESSNEVHGSGDDVRCH